MKKLILLFLIFASLNLSAQIVYESVQRTNIYDLLDELANEKLISINSVVKPYSRAFIAEKLQEAYDQKEQLSKRQIDEIEFYMKDYRLELIYNTKGMKPLNIFHKKDHIGQEQQTKQPQVLCVAPPLGPDSHQTQHETPTQEIAPQSI